MKIEKVNLVYFSPIRSTGTILKAIASVFDAEIVEHDYTYKIKSQDVPSFGQNELVIVGSPVYGGRLPEAAEPFFKKLKGHKTPVVPVVVFGNRDFEDALLELSDYLKENDFNVVSAGAFVAEHSFGSEIAGGRPDKEDINTAKSFGQEIIKKLESLVDISELAEIKVSGNFPYKDRGPAKEPWAPVTTDDCIMCGACVVVCPMGIINADNPKEITDFASCLHCCSCVQTCPVGAKIFTAEPFKKVKQFLIDNHSAVNKKAKLFL